MIDRRSFFKSLALLGAAAAGYPGIFIPKFEPVRWKITKVQTTSFTDYLRDRAVHFDEMILEEFPFSAREFCGKWTFQIGETKITNHPNSG